MPGKAINDKALEHAENSSRSPGAMSEAVAFLSMAYTISGKREEAIACVEDLKKEPSSHTASGLAYIYVLLGNREQKYAEPDSDSPCWLPSQLGATIFPTLSWERWVLSSPSLKEVLPRYRCT